MTSGAVLVELAETSMLSALAVSAAASAMLLIMTGRSHGGDIRSFFGGGHSKAPLPVSAGSSVAVANAA